MPSETRCPDVRIGHGYDLHRLEPRPPQGEGRPFILGGVTIEHDHGPVSHSDGDALLHAVTDAVLSIAGSPDIGTLFSDRDPEWADADSTVFLQDAANRLAAAGWGLANVDATVICERPKLGPHRDAIRARLGELLGLDPADVNVKAKTHEGVDAVGEGRAIEVHVVALAVRSESTT